MRELLSWVFFGLGAICGVAFMVRSSRHVPEDAMNADRSLADVEDEISAREAKDPILTILTIVGLACFGAGMWLSGMFGKG